MNFIKWVIVQVALGLVASAITHLGAEQADKYHELGQAYAVLERYDEAISALSKCHGLRFLLLGKDHPDTVQSRLILADVYRKNRGFSSAIKFYKMSIQSMLSEEGEASGMQLTRAYNGLGTALLETRQHDEAIQAFGQAASYSARTNGFDHLTTISVFSNLATAHRKKGDYTEAIELYTACLSSMVDAVGENHTRTAELYSMLASTFESNGELGRAIEYQAKETEVSAQLHGENSTETAYSHHRLCILYGRNGDFDAALGCFHKAHQIFVAVEGEDYAGKAKMFHDIGLTHGKAGQHDKAIEWFMASLAAGVATLGEAHPQTQLSRQMLSDAIDAKQSAG